MKKFPACIYVKIEKDGKVSYLVADADPTTLVDMGESISLGRYQLTRVDKYKTAVVKE